MGPGGTPRTGFSSRSGARPVSWRGGMIPERDAAYHGTGAPGLSQHALTHTGTLPAEADSDRAVTTAQRDVVSRAEAERFVLYYEDASQTSSNEVDFGRG